MQWFEKYDVLGQFAAIFRVAVSSRYAESAHAKAKARIWSHSRFSFPRAGELPE
jgi:hypothetical protein